MRLRDACPCRLGTFPDVVMASGMSLVCTEGHRIILSFNYVPKELDYAARQQKSKLASESAKDKTSE